MDFNVTTESKPVGDVVFLYSVPGMGKTTFLAEAARAEKGLFVPVVEDGLSPLQKGGELKGVPRIDVIKTWTDFRAFMNWFAREGSKTYKSVSVDSFNLIMASLEEYCFNKYFITNPENSKLTPDVVRAMAYGFGKSRLIDHMKLEIDKLLEFQRWCKDSCINLYISSHSTTQKVSELGTETEYERHAPDMPLTKKADLAGDITKEADFVLFGHQDINVVKSGNGKDRKKNKALDNGRVLETYLSPYWSAKRRGFMEDKIGFSYNEFKEALKGGKVEE
jgi:hypothetical protein